MNPDLLKQLQALFSSTPADATRAPQGQRMQMPPVPVMKAGMANATPSPLPDKPSLRQRVTALLPEILPVSGEILSAKRVANDLRAGKPYSAALEAALLGVGMVPLVGDVASAGARTAIRGTNVATDAAPLAVNTTREMFPAAAPYVNRPYEMRRIPSRPIPEAHQQAFNKFFGESKVRTPEGQPAIVVHGTSASRLGEGIDEAVDFNAFKLPSEGSGQLGIHFAVDPRQTDSFSTYDRFSNAFSERWSKASPNEIAAYVESARKPYGRSVPLYASMQNPLRLPELGEWSPKNVMPVIKEANPAAYDRIVDTAKRADINLNKLNESKLRVLLELSGYDGIVYRNQYEGVPASVQLQLSKIRDELKKSPSGRPSDSALAVALDKAVQELWPQAGDAYIAFNPTQLKSAIANVGTYDRRWRNISRGIVGVAGAGAAARAAQSSQRPEEQ